MEGGWRSESGLRAAPGPTSKAGGGRARPKTVVNKDLREDDVEENTSQPFRQAARNYTEKKKKINPAQMGQTNKLPENKEDPRSRISAL